MVISAGERGERDGSGLKEAICGRSGTTHTFDEVEFGGEGSRGRIGRVVDFLKGEVTESDVIAFYSKMMDVGARVGEIRALDFSDGARKLATEYGIGLGPFRRDGQKESKRERNAKMSQLVKLLCEIGPDIPEISRRSGQFKESVRYRYKTKILGRGFALQAMVDHEKLGLRRVIMVVEFDEKYERYAEAIFTAMNQLCYVVFFVRTLPEGLFIVNASVPEEHLGRFHHLMNTLKEKGLFKSLETHTFDWFRNIPMRAEFYDFDTGRWDFDWSHSSRRYRSTSFVQSQNSTFDDTDLLILKELQVNAARPLTEIASKLKIEYKKLSWHYASHVIHRRMIRGYRLNWMGTRYDYKIEKALHRKHRYFLIACLFSGLTEDERLTVTPKISSLPFLWSEAGARENYYAELFLPVDVVMEGIQYLTETIKPIKSKARFLILDQTNALAFTFSYQLFDSKEKTWNFDLKRLSTSFDELIMKIKVGEGG